MSRKKRREFNTGAILHPPAERRQARVDDVDDPIDVVDAARPRSAAGRLQGGPQPRIVGKVGVGAKLRMHGTRREQLAGARSRGGPPAATRFTWPLRSRRSITISMMSPSISLPTGPPASASGPT